MRRTLYLISVLLCISCINGKNSANLKIDFEFKENQIYLNNPSGKPVKFYYSIMGEPYVTETFQNTYNLNLIDYLKNASNNHKTIAYNYVKDEAIKMSIKDDYQLDTTIYITLPKLNCLEEISASVVSGECLPLVNKGNNDDIIGELKKWLYANNLHLNNEQVKQMKSVLIQLNSSNLQEFEPKNDTRIPVLKNFTGINYKVSSNMIADYYYLFAGTTQEEIEEFIGEVIAADFPHATKSLSSSMSCFRPKGKGGILYIFLIGVNKNWEKQVCPVGLVAIDNIKPHVSDDNNYTSPNSEILSLKEILGKSEGTITFPKYNTSIQSPNITDAFVGTLRISTGDFRGSNANFNISFSGDIESISIKREIKRSYMGLTPTTKTIKLSDKTSPYHFTFALDLPIGDNYIPITVKDKRGNITEHSYKITMVPIEDNNPNININNNIWN